MSSLLTGNYTNLALYHCPQISQTEWFQKLFSSINSTRLWIIKKIAHQHVNHTDNIFDNTKVIAWKFHAQNLQLSWSKWAKEDNYQETLGLRFLLNHSISLVIYLLNVVLFCHKYSGKTCYANGNRQYKINQLFTYGINLK